jgi:hypothetical protein
VEIGCCEADGIKHDIADVVDPDYYPLAAEILDRGLRRAEKKCTDMVGKHAVHFFRHASVAGPQPRLEVGDWYLKLAGGECAGQCRICVARHQNEVRHLCDHCVFERLQHSSGHLAVAAAVNPKTDAGLGDM